MYNLPNTILNFQESQELFEKQVNDKNAPLSNEQTTESDEDVITKKFKVTNQINWQGPCFSLAINETTIAVGSRSKVYIFNYQMELQQELFCHSCSDVTQLSFMKKSKSFVSAGCKSLTIWRFGNLNVWVAQKHFKEIHSINQFVNNDELIILCERDGKIIFIDKKFGEWKIGQIINQHALSIALNQSGNQMATYQIDKYILVYQLNNTWKKFQRIQVDQFGYNIGYINDQIIVVQPISGNKLELFKIKDQNYKKFKDIQLPNSVILNSSSSMQISNSIILCQNNKSVELIKIYNKHFFGLEESINLSSINLCFAMSSDEQHLITWDGKLRRFEVRIKQ